nr:M14 family metallopeptidase [Allomuricauda sp.]
MARPIFFLLLFCCLLICSCNGTPEVIFDTSFKGARLSDIRKNSENNYSAKVQPEFEPVNHSPWYAFGIQSEEPTTIALTLDYGKYQHRYVPKISRDLLHWESLDTASIHIDTINHTATLQLDVTTIKQYVSAQEIVDTDATYKWVRERTEGGQAIKLGIAGKTALGNNNYVMVSEKEGNINSLVLVARQHPPEIPGGTFAFQSFFDTLFGSTELATSFREQYNIYTFPLLNPDGVDMGNWRHNAKGVDLNRDWTKFSQPETKMVRDFLESKVKEGKKVRFAVDFHTSYSGPYVLVLDSINESRTAQIIPTWINKIETNSTFSVEARRRSQTLPYCYNYFFNSHGAEAVTYEEGDEINRDSIRARARVYAIELMRTLMEKNQENDW